MIRIDKNIWGAVASEFYDRLSKYLKLTPPPSKTSKKRGASKKPHQSKIDKWIEKAKDVKDSKFAEMLEFYRDNWSRISKIESVKELHEVNDEFYEKFKSEISLWEKAVDKDEDAKDGQPLKTDTSFGKFQARMDSVYDNFLGTKEPGYGNRGEWLADRLNILCCPYCNRHYTFTIKQKTEIDMVTLKEKVVQSTIRPQFDHFLPKSLYPLTAVCFFNLVPACPECNKLKADRILEIHPYEESFDDRDIRFSYDPTKSRKNPTIEITAKGKKVEGNRNVERLALLDLYQKHSDIATDLINKAEAYNELYYDTLVREFPGMGMTQEEIQRAVWGVSLSEKDMIKRPFSKFTRDILSQLGIKS